MHRASLFRILKMSKQDNKEGRSTISAVIQILDFSQPREKMKEEVKCTEIKNQRRPTI